MRAVNPSRGRKKKFGGLHREPPNEVKMYHAHLCDIRAGSDQPADDIDGIALGCPAHGADITLSVFLQSLELLRKNLRAVIDRLTHAVKDTGQHVR